jgi:hypothetical protein
MSSITPARPGTEAGQAWVLACAEGWLAPASGDAFADHFQPWFDPQVRLRQPLLPTLVGHQAFRERFAGRCSRSSPTWTGRWNASRSGPSAPTSS